MRTSALLPFLRRSGVIGLALACGSLLHADAAAHRQLAEQIIETLNPPAALKAAVTSAAAPVLEKLREDGAPESAIAEIRAAMERWAAHEKVWDDINPNLAAI
jgi:hypothetical protein